MLTLVLLLALVGTAVSTLGLGALVHYTLDIPWAAAFAFGALISATDPVAVIAFFKPDGNRFDFLKGAFLPEGDVLIVVSLGHAQFFMEWERFT